MSLRLRSFVIILVIFLVSGIIFSIILPYKLVKADEAGTSVEVIPSPPPPGGGGIIAPIMPVTTTGEVTITPLGGGKTTVTSAEGSKASIELPAYAVSVSTKITIISEAKATVIAATAPAPTGKSIIGSYIYNFTATAVGKAVTTFSKKVILTFTYTADQVKSLDESTLRIYYWKEATSKWVALASIVNTVTKTVTVTTDHLTYFILVGEPKVEVEKPITEVMITGLQAKIAEIARKIADLKTQISQLFRKKAIVEVPEIPPEEIVPPFEEILPEEEITPPFKEIIPSPEEEVKPPLNIFQKFWQWITSFWRKIWPF